MAEVRLTSAERAAARALLARYDAGYEANDEWDDEAAPLLRKALDALDVDDQLFREILEVVPYDVEEGPPGESWTSEKWKKLAARIRARLEAVVCRHCGKTKPEHPTNEDPLRMLDRCPGELGSVWKFSFEPAE